MIGFRRGWQGLLQLDPADPASVAANSIPLGREAVRGIDRQGGTVLHTSRTDPRTVAAGDRTAHVLHVLSALGVDAMVTLGGDGTLRFSAHLAAQGVPVISVPKTMDNDVYGTDYCIGFSTAVSRSVEAINALRTTVESHERIGVVELFGRRSGETALLAGFLAQVDRTVIAEVPAEPERLIPLLLEDRAGEPDALDRMVGFAFGGLAVELLAARAGSRMLAIKGGNYTHVPVDTLLQGTKSVDVDALYDLTAYRARLRRVEGTPMFLY